VAPAATAQVDASVAALYEQQASERPVPEPGASAAAGGERTLAAPAQRSEPAAAQQVEEVLDIEQLVTRAQAELDDARLAEHEVPLLATLSQQSKDEIPTLMYQHHDYSGNPAQSAVVINGKTLRTGESGGGVKVEEILPDSVVLTVKGQRFRLRALNSWINL
jgi:hypothetical protein